MGATITTTILSYCHSRAHAISAVPKLSLASRQPSRPLLAKGRPGTHRSCRGLTQPLPAAIMRRRTPLRARGRPRRKSRNALPRRRSRHRVALTPRRCRRRPGAPIHSKGRARPRRRLVGALTLWLCRCKRRPRLSARSAVSPTCHRLLGRHKRQAVEAAQAPGRRGSSNRVVAAEAAEQSPVIGPQSAQCTASPARVVCVS